MLRLTLNISLTYSGLILLQFWSSSAVNLGSPFIVVFFNIYNLNLTVIVLHRIKEKSVYNTLLTTLVDMLGFG